MEYIDKLYREKIDSMNQNDRIEFYSVLNLYKNKISTILTLMTIHCSVFVILSVMGIAIAVIGYHLRIVFDYGLFILGVGSVVLSSLFLILFVMLSFSLSKIQKEGKREIERILERRPKR